MENNIILSVKDLMVEFKLRGQKLNAIRGVSFDLVEGESLAIVGESGSGKSVCTKTLLGLLEKNGTITNGSIMYKGVDLAKISTEKEWLNYRGKEIAMVFQDPMTSLNPLKTVGKQIQETVERHRGVKGEEAKKITLQLLTDVGITEVERRYSQYAYEFSGGMRQRVVIAIALACNPKILICDEPTTALDVTIQAQILDLIQNLKEQYKLTVVYITHDLGVVAKVADKVAVMYAGDIIEIGTCNEVFYNPQHPYTWALLSALPQFAEKDEELFFIGGSPVNLYTEVKGDAFAPRNKFALKIDFEQAPPYFEVSKTHKAKTWLLHPKAPRVEPPTAIKKLRQMGLELEV